MEAGGLVSEANWSSFDPAMMPAEESEVMALLFGISDQDHDPNMGLQSVHWSDHNTHTCSSSENTNCIPYDWSQGGNYNTTRTSNVIAGSTSYLHILDEYCLDDTNAGAHAPMNFFIADEQPSLPVILMDEDASSDEVPESTENPPVAPLLPSDHCTQAMKRRLHEPDHGKLADDCHLGSAKKKSRITSAPVPKKGKNAQSKRSQKSTAAASNEAKCNDDMNHQSSSSCSSEESSVLLEPNGCATSSSSKGSGSLILSGKTRADRGSATDPQSLYARKRRERINERLRILQNLIPNGTKVDISTMLEEAVQYVKFLQIQIKLLSSDDLWMYAPIAYNGMNLGFDLKIAQAIQIQKRS